MYNKCNTFVVSMRIEKPQRPIFGLFTLVTRLPKGREKKTNNTINRMIFTMRKVRIKVIVTSRCYFW